MDHYNWGVLEIEDDVHVLTGCLKLFFRELKEPLIPCSLVEKALQVTSVSAVAERIRKYRGNSSKHHFIQCFISLISYSIDYYSYYSVPYIFEWDWNSNNMMFIEIIEWLPVENYDTLQYLLKHLLKITEYRAYNRMHISNLAIVFGPTLMWAATESTNLALDMMQQNLVVEALLNHYSSIFRWVHWPSTSNRPSPRHVHKFSPNPDIDYQFNRFKWKRKRTQKDIIYIISVIRTERMTTSECVRCLTLQLISH